MRLPSRLGRRRLVVTGTAAFLVLLFAVGLLLRTVRPGTGGGDQRAFAVPGQGGGEKRVVAEVLNSTDVAGLARAATLALRRRGIDVVYFGSLDAPGGGEPLDSTWVLARRADADTRAKAVLVARALGLPESRVATSPDTTRLVDASVLVGRDLAARFRLDP